MAYGTNNPVCQPDDGGRREAEDSNETLRSDLQHQSAGGKKNQREGEQLLFQDKLLDKILVNMLLLSEPPLFYVVYVQCTQKKKGGLCAWSLEHGHA